MKNMILAIVAAAFFTGRAQTFDVRAFGAKGDGTAKDTAAIQRAVDAAAAAGGGEVLLPAGTYLSGTVHLKSFIDFHLGPGAVLKGSADPADYNKADAYPQNWDSPRGGEGDNISGGHLLIGVNVRHVTLRGPGRIDGNAPAFMLDANGRQYPNWKDGIPWRPAQMIWFCDSSDLRITDVELMDPPYWTCFILNCDRVQIRGCYVHNESSRYRCLNGDGFDIDRCRFVTISDCILDVYDDAITLRASCADKLADPHDCAYVTVDNCTVSGTCDAIRIGVGEGRIHDAVFSNLVIHESGTAINLTSSYVTNVRGTDIEGVRFQNIRIRDSREFLRIHHMKSSSAVIRDIVFDGVAGDVREKARIWAHPDKPFENIVFRNVEIPHGVEIVNAKDVRFEGGSFRELPMSDAERAARSEKLRQFEELMN